MQRIIWSVFTMILFLTSSIYAHPVDGKMLIRIQKESSLTVSVKLANLKKERTKISILDLEGKPWFSEYAWGKNGYAKQLNLEKLPVGIYMLVIRNKMKTHTQVLAKQNKQIIFFDSNRNENPKLAQLIADGNTAITASFSTSGIQGINIKIKNLKKLRTKIYLNDVNGVLLAREVVKEQNELAKRFNLKGLPHGTYFFTIQHKQLQMVQLVTIDEEGVQL
ncbi:MAG: hypothetical protein AAFP82_15855, partial [Bacteroidota bacterium]